MTVEEAKWRLLEAPGEAEAPSWFRANRTWLVLGAVAAAFLVTRPGRNGVGMGRTKGLIGLLRSSLARQALVTVATHVAKGMSFSS
jgi:hypothetical protein